MDSTWTPLVDPIRVLDTYTPTGYFVVPANTFELGTKVKPQWIAGPTSWFGQFNPHTLPTATIQNPTPFGYISKVAYQNLDPTNYNDIPRSGNMPELVTSQVGNDSAVDASHPATAGTPNALGFVDTSGYDPTDHHMHDTWKGGIGGGGAGAPAQTNTSNWNVWTGNDLAGIDPTTEGAVPEGGKVGPGSDVVGGLRGVAAGFAGKIAETMASHAYRAQPYDTVTERFTPHQGILQPIQQQLPSMYDMMMNSQRKGARQQNQRPYLNNAGTFVNNISGYDGIVQMPNAAPATDAGERYREMQLTAIKPRMNLAEHGHVMLQSRNRLRSGHR